MSVQLGPGEQQFCDTNGAPLSGGSVAFYIPGTTTPKNTWQDAGKTVLNTNPVILDSAGRAIIYGNGSYRQIVKDSLGNQIWDEVTDEPAGVLDTQNSVTQWGGTSTGAANTYAITLSPAPGAYVAGQAFRFLTHEGNTGACTLNVNGLGAKAITKNGATALASGDISSGEVIDVVYDGTQFELVSPPGSLQVTAGTGLQSSGTIWSVNPSFFQGFIGGLTLSFNSATVLNIAAGTCTSDDNSNQMRLAGAYTKTTGAWAVGSGNGALDTGTVANNTGYHVFLILRTDTGVEDILFSTSATSPTMPANYTKKRRIGWFLTDGTASILAFVQNGDLFLWKATILDVSASSVTTTPANKTLSVPSGLAVIAKALYLVAGTSNVGWVYSPLINDEAAGGTEQNFSGTLSQLDILTNTSSQVRVVTNNAAGANVSIRTLGWIDTRGRFS